MLSSKTCELLKHTLRLTFVLLCNNDLLMSHIFISYSRKDKVYAQRLAEDIRRHGFDVWIDERIDYGDRWWRTIVEAINDCAAFVVVMSPHAEKSEWVESELLLAKKRRKLIFPLLLEGEEFALLITTQFVDVRDGSLPEEDFYADLAEVIQPTNSSGIWVTPPKVATSLPKKLRQDRFFLLWLAAVALSLLLALALAAAYLGGIFRGDNGNQATEVAENPTFTEMPTNTPASTTTSTKTPYPSVTPTDVPYPQPPYRNADWTSVEQDFSGVTMVLVPAGCFMMGSEDGEVDEQPINQQCFEKPFWLDKYEVTNAQYSSVGCEDWSSKPDQPRNCVNWFQARDFCEARGGRLPTEAEWEYAARGPDNLAYPWGNEFVTGYAVWALNTSDQTASVNSRPGSASWVGAQVMSGNLWEWTSSLPRDYPYNSEDGREFNPGDGVVDFRVLRGGSFTENIENVRATHRFNDMSSTTSTSYGFRCARDYTS
jgi:formylglycine-generating enzyme required for sulfatase activity